MKTRLSSVLIVLFFISSNFMGVANTNPPSVGDLYRINPPKNLTYKHLAFPELNIVAKRSGIANYKSVYGITVKVTSISTNKTGETIITLKRADGKKFFNYKKKVKAHLEKAIEAGELSKL